MECNIILTYEYFVLHLGKFVGYLQLFVPHFPVIRELDQYVPQVFVV